MRRVRGWVRYPETDRRGVVYHGHYLVWFELGRTELMREIGTPYAGLEAEGLFMPVIEAGARYQSPVRYDEQVEVETTVQEVTGVCVRFSYKLFRPPEADPVADGFTLHAAVNLQGSARRLPQPLRERLAALIPARENRA